MLKRSLPLLTVVLCFAVVPLFGLNAAELWNKGPSDSEKASKGTAPINPGGLKVDGESGLYSNSDISEGVEEKGAQSNSFVRKLKTTPMLVGKIPEERFSISKSLSSPVSVRKMVSSRVEEFMLAGAKQGRLSDVQNALMVERDTRKNVRIAAVKMQRENVRIQKENEKKHEEYVKEFNRRKNMSNAEILVENQKLYDAILRDKKNGNFEAMAKREFNSMGFAFKNTTPGGRVAKTKSVSLFNKAK